MIDALTITGIQLAIGIWLYLTGERTGSRKGDHVGQSHGRQQ